MLELVDSGHATLLQGLANSPAGSCSSFFEVKCLTAGIDRVCNVVHSYEHRIGCHSIATRLINDPAWGFEVDLPDCFKKTPLARFSLVAMGSVPDLTDRWIKAHLFKATLTSPDLFVRRCMYIFPSDGKFTTQEDEARRTDIKTYFLDAKCELNPANATDIIEPRKKIERPEGKWSITALASGEGRELQLVRLSTRFLCTRFLFTNS